MKFIKENIDYVMYCEECHKLKPAHTVSRVGDYQICSECLDKKTESKESGK